MVKEACPEEGDLAKPILSGKMSMLINILRESESVGDKVLIFSQSLASLDMIEEYLAIENDMAQAVGEPFQWGGGFDCSDKVLPPSAKVLAPLLPPIKQLSEEIIQKKLMSFVILFERAFI